MSRSGALRRLLLVASMAGTLAPLMGCTPRSPARDPFAGSGSVRAGLSQFRIRLEVVCDGCLIRYQIGPSGGSDSSSAGTVWSRRFARAPLAPEAIRLTASPDEEAGEVFYVRIYVNGEVAAEATCDCDPASGLPVAGRTLSAETVIGRE